MNTIKTQFIKEITVVDPDSNLEVEISIYKLETGGIIGIDSSFLDTDLPVFSPFDDGIQLEVE